MKQTHGPAEGGTLLSRVRWPDFMRAPRFQDPTRTRQAGVLNFVLWVGLSIILVHIGITLLLPATEYLNIYYEIMVAGLQALCLAVLHLRKPRLASLMYTLGLWLVVSLWVLEIGSITSTSVSTLYTVILVAGVLIGPVGGLSLAALSAAVVAYTAIINPDSAGQPDWAPAIIVILNFGLVALMAIIGEQALRKSFISVEHSRSLLSQRSAQLQAAAEIGLAATTSNDVDDFLRAVTQVIAERFGLHHVSILTLSQGTSDLTLNALSQGGHVNTLMPSFPVGSTPHGKSIIAHVARTRKPYLASDVRKDPLYLHHADLEEARSEIAVPIMEGARLFGVLDVISNKDVELGTDDLNALQILCNQLGTVIHNKRLLLLSRRHLDETRALHAIATAGMASTNEEEFLAEAGRVVGKSLFSDNFGILLIDPTRRVLEHKAYHQLDNHPTPNIPLGRGITGAVARTGRSLMVGDVRRDPDYLMVDERVRSEMCVPLRINGEVVGVLDTEHHSPNAFSQTDLQLLEALAGQISLALERIRLLADTERRAKELADTLKQQEELARLRDQFVQNVSHEFRTPLSIVSGYIEILHSGDLGPLPEAYSEPVEIIARRTSMLTQLVEDLTSLLNLQDQRSEFTTIYMGDVLAASYPSLHARTLAQQLELEWDVPNSMPPIYGEETLLRTMINSLMDNAIKFTPQGKVSLRAWVEGTTLCLCISDTGIGIPPDQQEYIFDRFYQVDGSSSRRFGGTGLGLALVKEIAELHGGGISFLSQPQHGTSFTVRIPIQEN
ncbi:MAG: GAF domain-containing protein [Anaerolineales bacterium]|nr:GAF domain-containing protein [Anaerolineales bacterium]